MNKYNYNSNGNDYKTPPEIYKKALEYFGLSEFSLDVCCSDNHIPAIMHYSLPEHDGLVMPWVDFSWCNPPYNECKKWIFEIIQKTGIKKSPEKLITGAELYMVERREA